jgi:DNA-binding MarR family transcriptional regulator
MMMLHPLIRHAARSRGRMRGDDLRVLIELTQHLDVCAFARVKLVRLAGPLALTEGQVSRSLKRLVDVGYLERRDVGPNRRYPEYRLRPEVTSTGEVACVPDLTRVQLVAGEIRRR